MHLPSRSVGFRRGAPSWGLDFDRYVPRGLVGFRRAGTTLDAKLWDLSRAGRLTGLANREQGLDLSATPYALGKRSDAAGSDAVLRGTAGIDVGWSPSPDLRTVVTVNTDFTETDVDTRQVNLTRFPLFFPEKRAFFPEGSNLFMLGLGLGATFVPFYSRRVGLCEGEAVPIDVGGKVVVRSGPASFAALDVRMRETVAMERTRLFAGRLTWDVDPHLRVGALVTDGDPTGAKSSTLGGIDAVWQTSAFARDKSFAVGAFWAGSRGTGPVEYMPRPRSGPLASFVHQLFFEAEGQLVTDLSGTTESWELFASPPQLRLKWGTRPRSLSSDSVLSAYARRWQAGAGVTWGSHYGGRLTELDGRLGWSDSVGHLPLRLSGLVGFGDRPEGSVVQRRFQLNSNGAARPDLVLPANAQYDTVSRDLGLSARARWTPVPGRDLILVWNHGWQETERERPDVAPLLLRRARPEAPPVVPGRTPRRGPSGPRRALADITPRTSSRPSSPRARSSSCGRTRRAGGRPSRTGARRSSRAGPGAGSRGGARSGSRRTR